MTTFNQYGFSWLVLETKQDENKLFKWDVITVKWTGFGPRPNWANELRVFLMNRIRKSDGFRY